MKTRSVRATLVVISALWLLLLTFGDAHLSHVPSDVDPSIPQIPFSPISAVDHSYAEHTLELSMEASPVIGNYSIACDKQMYKDENPDYQDINVSVTDDAMTLVSTHYNDVNCTEPTDHTTLVYAVILPDATYAPRFSYVSDLYKALRSLQRN